MILRDKLLNDADVFSAQSGKSLSRIAVLVAKDGRFFERLKKGGDCTTGMYERFQTFFKDDNPSHDG